MSATANMAKPPSNTDFMQLALAQGRLALPECLPNPPVGCVLVKDNVVISQGYTQAPGLHHAEAMALSQLKNDCSGVTAFVTLEPCSFHGRTPSCALALINSGVERVFVALLDPDPRNSGAGIRMLRDAGITVVVGLLAEKAAEDLTDFLVCGAGGSADCNDQ
ncbi:bifunctional diaminohydroxyphosphoribosylaminopyrimidine deaminase/5-amino-6-(5-phosphoribosylamino)uracil reductase RibD [Pseudomonas sp. RGM2987]|uniref:bifunctional diaminohydroxyphosphoribosylaminopyrimidine deaminase/5-amino-6-(5-phosphoribosylamino)uracil reductase RibD n=1 Tax=Pseudomonas sp. RGM2987 TaxID=2930090 RepID=UPI001FD6ED8D|nr:bifunctional diaminohydroxyphosphoribosylaminopyrimidine deaminase/5-amino-6-(5-phosphoribosylamino)uracil reductase RibD [Pseudomonas sp. RGM2987]MCJ8207361.1 bifunctional diaminohydroxyphosphoribosylaminopyrimidine deaminase/5-amino-6-(5-phosphoribosylamino)uracil reductase RibD [Pseudomonas sp. RGM2987]